MNKELISLLKESIEIPKLLDPKLQEEKGITKADAENLYRKARMKVNKMKEQYDGLFCIADHFQLARVNGNRFSIDSRTEITKKRMVLVSMVLTYNADWANCGQIYIVDEAATYEFQATVEKEREENEAKVFKQNQIAKNGGVSIAPAPVKLTYGVGEDGIIYKNVHPDDVGDYLFTGSEVKCNTYKKENFDKNGKRKTGEEANA